MCNQGGGVGLGSHRARSGPHAANDEADHPQGPGCHLKLRLPAISAPPTPPLPCASFRNPRRDYRFTAGLRKLRLLDWEVRVLWPVAKPDGRKRFWRRPTRPFRPRPSQVSLTPENAQFCPIMHQKAKRKKSGLEPRNTALPAFCRHEGKGPNCLRRPMLYPLSYGASNYPAVTYNVANTLKSNERPYPIRQLKTVHKALSCFRLLVSSQLGRASVLETDGQSSE